MTDTPHPLTPRTQSTSSSPPTSTASSTRPPATSASNPADARARLAATPVGRDRRAALSAARDVLAQVPPVDELHRGAPARRRRRTAADEVAPVPAHRARPPLAARPRGSRAPSRPASRSSSASPSTPRSTGSESEDGRGAERARRTVVGSARRAAHRVPPTAARRRRGARAVDLGTFRNVATLTRQRRSRWRPRRHADASSAQSSTASRSFSTESAGSAQRPRAPTTEHSCTVTPSSAKSAASPRNPSCVRSRRSHGPVSRCRCSSGAPSRVLVVVTADCRLVSRQALTTP